MKKIQDLQGIESIGGIVAILQFGSYGTDDWIEGRSDIDFLILMAPRYEYEQTLDIEDDLETLLMQHYDYDDIHISFVLYKDYESKYARLLTDSDQTFIIDEKNWFDFQHYVLKYARNNKNFEQKLIKDEQYTCFGRKLMAPYYKYKKEKFYEKYKSASDTLDDLKIYKTKGRIS